MNRWIIVPAAGTGSRFGGDVPKQYQLLNDKTVIEHTLERLLAVDESVIVVAVNKEDDRWQQLEVFDHPRIRTVVTSVPIQSGCHWNVYSGKRTRTIGC